MFKMGLIGSALQFWILLLGAVNCESNRFQYPMTNRNGINYNVGYSTTCNCSWGSEAQDNYQTRSLNFRVVGGIPVKNKNIYPMVAGLVHPYNGCTICGATILTEHHVVTAAHCVYDGQRLILSVGRLTRCIHKNDGGQSFKLYPIYYIHPQYDVDSNFFDIAIVLTERKIVFSNSVAPACIQTDMFINKRDPIWIMGWGRRTEEGAPNQILHKVYVQLVEIDGCRSTLPEGWVRNDSTQICTYRYGKDACTGDSGGPLFWLDPRIHRFTLIGLVSMGLGCARPNIPAVNTAVFPFLDWIYLTIDNTWETLLSNKRPLGDSRRQFCHIQG